MYSLLVRVLIERKEHKGTAGGTGKKRRQKADNDDRGKP